jgi:rSAM/selenodomain-associated transferase 1
MARLPAAPGKTRLADRMPPDRLRALRRALLADTLATVRSSGLPVIVFATPAGSTRSIRTMAGGAPIERQCDGDLGARMAHAVDVVCRQYRHAGALLVGTDVPMLTAAHLHEARASMRERRVVFGPARDGGYYLAGLTAPAPAIFQDISWGTASVLVESMAAASRHGFDVQLIEPLGDVDTIDDLRRTRDELATAPRQMAPALRRWFALSAAAPPRSTAAATRQPATRPRSRR